MKKLNETKPKHAYAALGALLLVASFSTPASAEVAEVTAFTMAVISNQAHGAKVTSGKYEQAIKKLTDRVRRSRDRFADQNNLCVAYAKNKDMQKAGDACNAAIVHMNKQKRRVSGNSYVRSAEVRAYRSDLALALSNRGVLLAVAGDTELAREDFLAALELQTRLSPIIQGNLYRLEQKSMQNT